MFHSSFDRPTLQKFLTYAVSKADTSIRAFQRSNTFCLRIRSRISSGDRLSTGLSSRGSSVGDRGTMQRALSASAIPISMMVDQLCVRMQGCTKRAVLELVCCERFLYRVQRNRMIYFHSARNGNRIFQSFLVNKYGIPIGRGSYLIVCERARPFSVFSDRAPTSFFSLHCLLLSSERFMLFERHSLITI